MVARKQCFSVTGFFSTGIEQVNRNAWEEKDLGKLIDFCHVSGTRSYPDAWNLLLGNSQHCQHGGQQDSWGSCQEGFSYRCRCCRIIPWILLDKNKQPEALSFQVKVFTHHHPFLGDFLALQVCSQWHCFLIYSSSWQNKGPEVPFSRKKKIIMIKKRCSQIKEEQAEGWGQPNTEIALGKEKGTLRRRQFQI